MARGDEAGLAVLLGGGSGDSSDMGSDMDSDMGSDSSIGSDDAFKDAAISAMTALQEGNEERFADHLKDAIEICLEKKDSHGDDY
tara:strand:+ start:290 stop:544 length:255 start_codon:yes stop_codon:yes gene_type:complete